MALRYLGLQSVQPSPAPISTVPALPTPPSAPAGKMPHLHAYCSLPWEVRRGWNVDWGTACAVAKQLELRSASFPASANSALGCFVPARNQRSWVACTLFWSWLRFHQLTQRQKGWQPVKIPGASLLHPVSVCWTKRWREALADSAHQFSTYFFNLGRKQISWPWFHSRETCRTLIAGHGRMTLLRLSSSHPVARLHLCHEEKANCDARAQHCSACLQTFSICTWKITQAGSWEWLLNPFWLYDLGRCLKLKMFIWHLKAWHIQW